MHMLEVNFKIVLTLFSQGQVHAWCVKANGKTAQKLSNINVFSLHGQKIFRKYHC